MSDKPLIVFDLGGVLVRVNYTWGEVLRFAGLSVHDSMLDTTKLDDAPGYRDYQAGLVSYETYLEKQFPFLGLTSVDQGRLAHEMILREPISDTSALVDEIHAAGFRTAILSNTNEAHWDVMKIPDGRFPAVATLHVPVLSHEVKQEKPDRAIYETLERLSGFRGEDIIYFDDLEENVAGGAALGWRAHRIDPDADPAAQMRRVLHACGVLRM